MPHSTESKEIKVLNRKILDLEAELSKAANTIGKERNEAKKWRDKYSMLMSVVRPLCDAIKKLE